MSVRPLARHALGEGARTLRSSPCSAASSWWSLAPSQRRFLGGAEASSASLPSAASFCIRRHSALGPVNDVVLAWGSRGSPVLLPSLSLSSSSASFSTIPARTFFFDPGGSSERRREFSERRVLGYSMAEMFDVVADVEKYQDFLPFCTRSEICKKRGDQYLECELEIGFPPFVESYVSVVEMSRPHWLKTVGTDGSLFNHLVAEYRFSPGLPSKPRSCTMDFSISYEFRNQLYAAAADAAFETVQRQQVEAFLKRARKKYGPPAIGGGELR